MAIVMTMDFPATTAQYDKVNERIGIAEKPPEGLIVHASGVTQGGMRTVDVWESEEAFNKFQQERLGPAVAEVLGGPPADAGERPGPEILEIYNLVKP
jgi:hypothetical protein